MSLVEQKYNEALDNMSGQERLSRTFSLFDEICEMVALQASKDYPTASMRQLQIKVAERLYASDPGVLALLKKAATS